MPDAAELAFKNLERVLSRDPMLRDVLEQTVPKSKRGGRFTPDVDVVVGSMYIAPDMPGIPKEHLNIELQDAQLIVTGKSNHHPEHAQVVSSERQSGTFKRVFCYPHRYSPAALPRTCQTGCLPSRYQKLAMAQRRPYRSLGQYSSVYPTRHNTTTLEASDFDEL